MCEGKRCRSRRYTWQRPGFASAASHEFMRATGVTEQSEARCGAGPCKFPQSPLSVNVFTDSGDPLCGTHCVALRELVAAGLAGCV